MQSVNEKEAPYIVDWGAATEEFPKILGVIKINNIVEGYVVMQCKKGEITEERMKAMSIIQEACSLMLKGKTAWNRFILKHLSMNCLTVGSYRRNS